MPKGLKILLPLRNVLPRAISLMELLSRIVALIFLGLYHHKIQTYETSRRRQSVPNWHPWPATPQSESSQRTRQGSLQGHPLRPSRMSQGWCWPCCCQIWLSRTEMVNYNSFGTKPSIYDQLQHMIMMLALEISSTKIWNIYKQWGWLSYCHMISVHATHIGSDAGFGTVR